LTRVQNAIRMLFERVSTVKAYLEAVQAGTIKDVDHALLRRIQNLIAMLPTMSTTEFRLEALTVCALCLYLCLSCVVSGSKY
jgi:hypothetical protein